MYRVTINSDAYGYEHADYKVLRFATDYMIRRINVLMRKDKTVKYTITVERQ